MAHGQETSPEVVAQFRAHYLLSGNASESARAVEIPESTGRDIARRLVEDAEFVADRRKLRTHALDELVAMRMRVARKSLERFEAAEPDPIPTDDGGCVLPQDKRPEFGRLVLDAEKSAQHLAKIDKDASDGDKPAPVVRVILKDDDGSDD